MIRKEYQKNKCDTTLFRKLSQNVRNGQTYLQLIIIFEIGKIYLHYVDHTVETILSGSALFHESGFDIWLGDFVCHPDQVC